MAHYLVTGGAGFIGAHLVKLLRDSAHEIRILDDFSAGKRENIPEGVLLIEADIADGDAVRQAVVGVDGIFHLAADPSVPRCLSNYLRSHRTNMSGTIAVLDAAAKEGAERGCSIPVVYASSCAVYGDPENVPLKETSRTAPLSGYGADKLGSEIHAQAADGVLGVPTVGLRLFNVYGPGQDPGSPYSGVLSIFCGQVASGREVTIYGDGRQVRDFIYVGDAVTRFWEAMERARDISPRVINVCTGYGSSLLDVGEKIAAIRGRPFLRNHEAEREGDIKISVGDPALSNSLLGPFEATPLDIGLTRTLGIECA